MSVINYHEGEQLTPLKAIRARCFQCSCGSAKEIRECTVKGCALYRYRLGHRPLKEFAKLK